MSLRIILLLACFLSFFSCSTGPTVTRPAEGKKEVLIVYPDGTMMLNGRIMNKEDVAIYPDGFGGERALVRVIVPLHPDFFRDTIPVERIEVVVERRE